MENAIVIGASSGIGRALAEILVRKGYRVGITGRRLDLLESVRSQYPDMVHTLSMDVQENEGLEASCEALAASLGGVDLLVISAGIGIQGFDAIEPVILAALATGDPLLLIGHAGTGKTLLLNRLASALGLVHRHYNAALVSFDDLVGYPYPSADGSSVTFLPTPATIWRK